MKADEGNNRTKSYTVTAVLLTVAAAIAALNGITLKYPGQVLLPTAKALLLIGMVSIYGFFVLSLFNRGQRIPFPTALGTGLMVICFIFFGFCFLNVLMPVTVTVFYIIPLFLLGFILRDKTKRMALIETLEAFFKRPFLEYPVFFLPFIYAMLPPSFYDSLVYHLGIPNMLLAHGGFIETPQFFFANTSVYYEVSLIPVVFAGELVPRLFHFILGSIFILAIVDYARDLLDLDKKTKIVLTVLAVSMPVSLFLLSTVKSDLPAAFFMFLGIRFLLDKRYILSGLFWGFAVGVKYFSALGMGIFIFIFLIIQIKENGFRGIRFKKLAVLSLVALAVMGPLLIKNYIYAGNPAFPFLSQWEPFRNSYWDSSRFQLMRSDVGKMFHSAMDVLKFPYTISFEALGFGGVVGAQFLIFLPFLWIIREHIRKKWLILLFSTILLWTAGFFTGSIRFVYLGVLFLTAYVALVYSRIPERLKWLRCLLWLVIGLNLATGLGFQEQLYRSHRLLMGSGDTETYKASMFPTYKAIAFVNNKAKLGARVLLAGEARNYYLKVPYSVATGIDYSVFKRYLEASTDADSFFNAITNDGFTYIIFNLGEATRLQRNYERLKGNEWERVIEYLKAASGKTVFGQNGVFVLKLY